MPSVYYENKIKNLLSVCQEQYEVSWHNYINIYIYKLQYIILYKKQKVLSVKGFEDYEYACDIFISSRYLL